MASKVNYTLNNKKFAELKLSNPLIKKRSLAADKLTFRAPGASIDKAPLFAYGNQVTLLQDSNVLFRGTVVTPESYGSPREERIEYEAMGAWWWLERIVYMQQWKVFTAGALTTTLKSRVILGQDSAGKKQTVAQAITEIFAYAIGAGAQVQLGAAGPTVEAPWDEAVDVTCAEAIRKLLRWSLDIVSFSDYSASPPRIHFVTKSQLPQLTAKVMTGNPFETVKIRRRTDFAATAVVILFEREDWTDARKTLEDGATPPADDGGITGTAPGDDESTPETDIKAFGKEVVDIDAYPPDSSPSTPGAIVATVELASGNMAYISQTLKVKKIPSNLKTAKDWWKEKVPFLANLQDSDITIQSTSRDSSKPNEIIEGQVQTWMTGDEVDDSVQAVVDYTVRDGDNNVVKLVKGEVFTVKLRVTSANGGFYTKLRSLTEEEKPFIGLAKRVYDAVNSVEFDGELTMVFEDINPALSVGNTINLTGGRPEWATMQAIIQESTWDLTTGTVVLKFGPPAHLSVQDFLEQLRANRGRRTTINYLTRTSGDARDKKPNVNLGKNKTTGGVTTGGGSYSVLRLKAGGNDIELDPASFDKAGRVLTTIEGENGAMKAIFDVLRLHE